MTTRWQLLLYAGAALAIASCDRAAAGGRTDTTTKNPASSAPAASTGGSVADPDAGPADGTDSPMSMMGPRRTDTGNPGSRRPRRSGTGTNDTNETDPDTPQ